MITLSKYFPFKIIIVCMLAKAIILDEIKYDSEVIIDVKDNELIIKADK